MNCSLLLPEFDIFEQLSQRTHLSSRCQCVEIFNLQEVFLSTYVRIRNYLHYTVFETVTLKEFRGAVSSFFLPSVEFYPVLVAHVLVRIRMQFLNTFDFTIWTCAADLIN